MKRTARKPTTARIPPLDARALAAFDSRDWRTQMSTFEEMLGGNSSKEKISTLYKKRKVEIVLVEAVADKFAASWIDGCVNCRLVANFRVVRQNPAGDDVVTTHCYRHLPKAVGRFLKLMADNVPEV